MGGSAACMLLARTRVTRAKSCGLSSSGVPRIAMESILVVVHDVAERGAARQCGIAAEKTEPLSCVGRLVFQRLREGGRLVGRDPPVRVRVTHRRTASFHTAGVGQALVPFVDGHKRGPEPGPAGVVVHFLQRRLELLGDLAIVEGDDGSVVAPDDLPSWSRT